MAMNENDTTAHKHFLAAYSHQYQLNYESRQNYDEDLEYYTGYRDRDDYPLAYNMTFPLLLPRIMSMLSRMLEQLYQGSTHDFVGVRPRKRGDIERAQRVQGLLNYQLETLNDVDIAGGSYMFNFHWMLNALSWGKGIAKVYWRKEERISPLRVQLPIPRFDQQGRIVGIDTQSILTQAPQIIYDAPYAEVLHNKLFTPHPHFKNIQQMPFVFCTYRKSVDHIKRLADQGIYRNIDGLGTVGSAGHGQSGARHGQDSAEKSRKSLEIEGYIDLSSYSDKDMAPEVDIVEGYGKYIFPEDESPYEIGSGVKIKGKESEAIVHIGNYQTLLKIQKNEYGFKPFFDIGGYWHPELYWDMGIIRLGKSIQEQYDTMANTRFQNALMGVNAMLLIEEDSDIPPESLIWKPFGVIPGGLQDGVPQVQALANPDFGGQLFREQEEFFTRTIEDMTGMTRFNMGSNPQRRENVGTVVSLQAAGESRMKLLLMTMDHQGFQPLLKHFMRLNTWHLPDGFEARVNDPQGNVGFSPMFPGDIHPDYDFTARYTAMEPALSKQFKAQQLIQYAQLWQGSPFLRNYQFMKAIMEMMDFQNTDKYLNTPEQVQQQQQAAMQQQIAVQMQSAAIQDQLTGKQQTREMERDVIKGLVK